MATTITVAGQVFTVQGTREDITALCKRRTLTADDGFRELRTVEGEDITINTGAVALIAEANEGRKAAVGFLRGAA